MENSSLLISLRCHYLEHNHIDFYMNQFTRWLKYRDYTIESSSFGLHKNTGNDHFHYHLITHGKPLSNPLGTMKRDFEVGKVETFWKTKQECKEYPKTFTKNLYKGRINMSLRMTQNTDGCQDFRFIQYPLKEGLTVHKYNHNLDDFGGYDQLKTNAVAEYTHALNAAKQKEEKKEKQLTEWQELVILLDKREPTDFEQVFRTILYHYKTESKKPPTIRCMKDNAERYSFMRGIITIEEIINMLEIKVYKDFRTNL